MSRDDFLLNSEISISSLRLKLYRGKSAMPNDQPQSCEICVKCGIWWYDNGRLVLRIRPLINRCIINQIFILNLDRVYPEKTNYSIRFSDITS